MEAVRRGGRGSGARFALGLLLGGVPVLAIWLVEPLPASPFEALDLVPSSPVSYLLPMAVAVLAAVRLGGSGLAGVLVGAVAGFLLATAIAGPTYEPHPWDELDGVWSAWFRVAGLRTEAVTAFAGLVAWTLATIVRLVREVR